MNNLPSGRNVTGTAILLAVCAGMGLAQARTGKRFPDSINLVHWGMARGDVQQVLGPYKVGLEVSAIPEITKAEMKRTGVTTFLSDTCLVYNESILGQNARVELKFSFPVDSLAQIAVSFDSPDTAFARILGDTLVQSYGPPLGSRKNEKSVLLFFTLKTVTSIWNIPAGTMTFILFYKGDDLAIATLQYSPPAVRESDR